MQNKCVGLGARTIEKNAALDLYYFMKHYYNKTENFHFVQDNAFFIAISPFFYF